MGLVQLQAFGDLLRRYGAVFRTAWSMRAQLDGEPKLAYERAFLPANLELVETPVHPAPRWAMRTLVAFAVLTVLLAAFGRLDIVAVAEGKLIPDERVKIIQPAITGVVRGIFVEDGQRVQAGQLLIQLDATQAAADSDNARTSRVDATLAAARSQALLDAQTAGHAPVVSPVDGASVAQQAQAQHFAEGLYREYQDKLDASKAELRKREAELDTTRVEIGKLSATAPLAREQANQYRSLAMDKYVAQTDYLTKEQAALDQEHDLAARESSSHELMAAVEEQRADIASTVSAFRSTQLETLDKATQQYTQSRDDETKADTRQKLLSVTAPVAGTVQQLTVHTLGGVATAAQAVMEIVPDNTLEVEADIENKDIGFVRPGQTALVKVNAFPYTTFGYLTGTVVSVSNDAVQDRKRGLIFVTRVRLPTNRIRANGAWVRLTPGMEVSAEIHTGKRSVAAYFLDPVIRSGQESLRER